jgi:hypothetical protein
MKQDKSKNESKSFLGTIKLLGTKLGKVFQPEEVEVTFNTEGKNKTYTYTKVSDKQVA